MNYNILSVYYVKLNLFRLLYYEILIPSTRNNSYLNESISCYLQLSTFVRWLPQKKDDDEHITYVEVDVVLGETL